MLNFPAINNFNIFCSDLGARPGPEYSLERIEVNGNYCKENCKWGTPEEQAINQRARTIWRGETPILTDEAILEIYNSRVIRNTSKLEAKFNISKKTIQNIWALGYNTRATWLCKKYGLNLLEATKLALKNNR